MNLNTGEEQFIIHAKRLLDESVQELDVPTTRRLQHARLHALTAKPVRTWVGIWTGGLAMAAVGALSLTIWLTQPTHERPHTPLLDDLELITSTENVELAEDLEFYHWLADADTTG